jgi:hypothetical protein
MRDQDAEASSLAKQLMSSYRCMDQIDDSIGQPWQWAESLASESLLKAWDGIQGSESPHFTLGPMTRSNRGQDDQPSMPELG